MYILYKKGERKSRGKVERSVRVEGRRVEGRECFRLPLDWYPYFNGSVGGWRVGGYRNWNYSQPLTFNLGLGKMCFCGVR